MDAFLEEAVVRRELSDNYCFYTPNYDTLDACYPWARETLQKHASEVKLRSIAGAEPECIWMCV